MSFCAKYIQNPVNCEDEIQEQTSLEQNIFNSRKELTPNFSLSPDNSYYQLRDGSWTSSDPRLYDVIRGFKVCINEPPLSLNIDKNLKNLNYSQKPRSYNSIQDIDLGDVKYYYNTDVHQPFNTINFTTPTNVTKKTFIDPMTSVKPEYSREKLIYGIGCDQETRDQLSFREDMMERILRKQNQRLF